MNHKTFYKKLTLAVASAALIGAFAFVQPAFSDGAPKPPPPANPLDKALDQIQNKEPPVAVAPAPAPAPEPVIEQTPPPPAPESRVVEVQPNTSFFGLSIGIYDVTHGNNAAAFNLEWQPGVKILGVLQPLFGAFATTNGAVMGYGGIGAPIHFGKHFFVTPSFAVGGYGHGGGYDLGQVLAFRAGAEIGYQFDDKSRIGLNVHGIGTSLHRNDRTEIISLNYTIPFNLFSGTPHKPPLAVTDTVITTTTGGNTTMVVPTASAPPPPEAPAPAADQAVEQGLKK